METYGVLIGGKSRAGRGPTQDLIEPSTGEPFARLAAGHEDDVNEAVEVAGTTFRTSDWWTRPPIERAKVLFEAARRISERSEEIARLETRNVGRPIRETRNNVRLAADDFTFYASIATHLRGATVPMGERFFDYTRYEPIGVCGLIVPWNNPINLLTRKVAPALAAGNAVVVKPSGATPISALIVAEILQDCGLPPGQLNVVPGAGSTVGNTLINHPDVRKISFTGATSTGRTVMHAAAERIARVSLELGGKSPALVFADADLEAAVSGSVAAMFVNAGQTCTARSRILVEAPVYDRFLEGFVERVRSLHVGDPMDPHTDMGPLISEEQLISVLGYVERAVAAGARVATGGRRLEGLGLTGGFYMEPTVLVDVRDDMEAVCEEIFGPVVVVDSFESEKEAIERSNDTPFGLAATIWTKNVDRAYRVAEQLEAGTVTVNTSRVSHAYAPFGGYKQSGIGRELGLEGIYEYLQVKNVVVELDG